MNRTLIQDFLRLLPQRGEARAIGVSIFEMSEELESYNASAATRKAFNTAIKIRATGVWPQEPAPHAGPEIIEKGSWSFAATHCTEG